MPEHDDEQFRFDFSLSVLNHLGRNLYRNFITVLGEAISNAWDADANNVWIDVDLENSTLVIKDDGLGMTADDFQNKFLKVGYSKRDDFGSKSSKRRPFIGRKGIGKLALLSCADVATIATKTSKTGYTGGQIDNKQLDQAIDKDKTSQEYILNNLDTDIFQSYLKNHEHGTILYFTGLKDGISNTVEYLRKAIALYFRFSLVDDSFKVYLNNKEITYKDLKELGDNTQFLWELNLDNKDPYIDELRSSVLEQTKLLQLPGVSGFIATVTKPSHLKIFGTGGEKVGVDLFVNGRLRESNVLKHIPSAQLPENYVYGQIHYDALDDGTSNDRFTSSREGILADDELFKEMLRLLNGLLVDKNGIYDQWDAWRLKHKQDGNDENTARKSKRDRASAKLLNETINDFKDSTPEATQTKIDQWYGSIAADAEFNVGAYTDCFISENLIRQYIVHKKLGITDQDHIDQVTKYRRQETDKKSKGNLTIDIRSDDSDLYYLSTEPLVDIAEPSGRGDSDALHQDEKQFTPIRNAVMHTSLLTVEARTRMVSIRDNIRGKIKKLLEDS